MALIVLAPLIPVISLGLIGALQIGFVLYCIGGGGVYSIS